MMRLSSVVALALLSLTLAGCPEEGVVCQPGTTACGETCVDLLSDALHCGACATSCAEGQTCQEGSCGCREGASSCDGACVALLTDVAHCGACGNACDAAEVCEAGACGVSCSEGLTQCGRACVDVTTDVAHCGGCGEACADVQTCRAGECTYDAVAACYSTGQVVGLRANGQKGALKNVGNHPVSLGRMGGTIFVADDDDTRLRQAALPDLALRGGENATGGYPAYQSVSGDHLFVTVQGPHAVLIFRRTGQAADAGTSGLTPGVELVPESSAVVFGDNTFPNNAVVIGDTMFVPLQGALFGDASAGQKVARVDVSDPTSPEVLSPPYDLTGIDLKAFDGANPQPFPQAAVVKNGQLYVGLTSADPATFGPGGPGMIVRIDPSLAPGATGAITPIELGSDCTNSGFLAVAGDRIVVSCLGVYGSAEGAGVALVGADDTVKSKVPVTGFNPGRIIVSGDRVIVGNYAGADALVLRIDGDTLVPERGAGASENSMAVCPVPAMGFASVTDLISLP